MVAQSKKGRFVLYLLIFLSGISGLIYQVVWHKYLSILLGAQARATAVVLAIFLGGISLGYHFFGRWSRSTRWNLLLCYCLVELGLAVWAFAFPFLFRAVMPLTYRLYGWWGLESLWIDLIISCGLLGIPTFLMGGTLPLLTQGLSEDVASASQTHARIYGWNTVGACMGSVLAGYVLIPKATLPIAVAMAGAINALVGASCHFLFARTLPATRAATKRDSDKRAPLSVRGWLLVAVGFCSGFYVLTLETVLIRLVGLSTGSSHYNFTLIVSIFVFGLGFGSLLVRRLREASGRRLFWNQLCVSLFLLLLYFSADRWSYWVHLVRITLRDSPENFYLYQAALGALFLALLVLPVGFCGLALPLCFHLLKDRKETLGYRVGQLYGVNTLGCVLGAIVGGYLLLEVFNLDDLFRICLVISLLSAGFAGWLWFLEQRKMAPWELSLGSAVLSLIVAGVSFAPPFTKERFIQPFRQQSPISGVSHAGVEAWTKYLSSSTEYLFYKDGPNTSVGIGATVVNGQEKSRTVFVNGKSDGNTRGDFFTMAMTGHFPGLLARRLDRACVIGFGTGITVGTLLKYPETRAVDVVEIADTIIENAHYFDAYNGGVSKSPRVKFHGMDAFRFLGGTKERFDVIISEPSNPWVSGVENLYSSEFYDIAKEKLADDGLFIQWIQAYSFNDDLFKMVLKTITGRFAYVSVFQMLEHDMALVASMSPIGRADLERARARYEKELSVRRSLMETGLTRFETVLALELIPAALSRQLAGESEEHSLEAPRLSHSAARAFFTNVSAQVHTLRRSLKEYFPAVEHSLLSVYLAGNAPDRELLEAFRASFCEQVPSRSRVLCEEAIIMGKYEYPSAPFEMIYEGTVARSDLREIASLRPTETGPKSFTSSDLKSVQDQFDLVKRYYSPIARLPVEPLLDRLDACVRLVAENQELHGDCLLQKSAILEIVRPHAPEFKASLQAFRFWFGKLSPQSEEYRRFKRANEILEKMESDLDKGVETL